MSLARKHVIAAGFVAFVAWAALTDWAPSLRWIPYAFITGVLVTAGGLAYVLLTTSKGALRKQDEYVSSGPIAPAFSNREAWEEEKLALRSRAEYRRPLIFPEAVVFSRAADETLDWIIRDFVTSWYQGISKRPLFQHEIDRTIRSVLLALAARLTNFDLVQIGVSKMLPVVTAHLKEFYDAERAVRGRDLSHTLTDSEELNRTIAGKYNHEKLHPVAAAGNSNISNARQRYSRAWVVKLLPILLPENMKTSPAVLALVREIVTCAVLDPIIQAVIDPNTWNELIVNIGGPMLQDRKAVRKMLAALDQNAPASPNPARSLQFPRLRPQDNDRQYERFIRAIRMVSSLSEARRFRSEVLSQLRRDASQGNQDASYIRRLETGKRLLDEKVANLSADGASKVNLSHDAATDNGHSLRKRQASLREVLYDASGLSYFMEFMDRLKLMKLVQFYIVVDGFRGPLEGDYDEGDPDETYERMDIAQMYEAYLSKKELQASDEALEAAKRYLREVTTGKERGYADARRAVLQTQTRVYETMKDVHYQSFKASDLYYKWLAIDDNPAFSASIPKRSNSSLSTNGSRDRELSSAKRRPHLIKASELRRAVLSSTNLQESSRLLRQHAEPRRSLDDGTGAPLFTDDVDDERMTQSLSHLKSYDSDNEAADHARKEAKAVSAMQLALDDIVGAESNGSLFAEHVSTPSPDAEMPIPLPYNSSARSSLDQSRPTVSSRVSENGKPNIASLGLVGGPSSRGVFVDDLFSAEAEHFVEDERESSEGSENDDEPIVQEAAPGDLGLTEAIDALSTDIERLTAQKQIVDSLTAKAELTNNAAELRILRKSEASLLREIKRKELQKQQYTVQEGDNSLYGRAAVTIKSVMIGREQDGHEYALYVIQVRRQAGEQNPAATWAVTRRYSQFHELHKRLRARFPSVGELEFPRRQALFTLQRDFVEKRRMTLERYLRSLLLVPAICRSRELRAFLSQSSIISAGKDDTQVDTKDFVTRIYNSVSDGMEEFLGNIPVLDQLSVAGQNLISAATSQINSASSPIDSLDPATQDPSTAAEAQAELNAYEAKDAEPFVKPICDLFLEAFELSKGNSWLRGRTVVVVLHQLLGGTIERRVREVADAAMGDERMAGYVKLLQTTMWPDGSLRRSPVSKSQSERARTHREAALILDALIPDMAGGVVGRAHAKAASRKIMAMLNNDRLNIHLVFTLIDELLRIIFPEMLDTF